MESKKYTNIGRWWDRKGEFEIDMVAANELDNTVEITEIKRNRKNINFTRLQEKADLMLSSVGQFKGYASKIKGLDMQDM